MLMALLHASDDARPNSISSIQRAGLPRLDLKHAVQHISLSDTTPHDLASDATTSPSEHILLLHFLLERRLQSSNNRCYGEPNIRDQSLLAGVWKRGCNCLVFLASRRLIFNLTYNNRSFGDGHPAVCRTNITHCQCLRASPT